jgi:hypothetical protein
MQRITVVADPQCDMVFPDQAPAILAVLMNSGERRVECVMANRCGPDRPLTQAELVTKFAGNVKRAAIAHRRGAARCNPSAAGGERAGNRGAISLGHSRTRALWLILAGFSAQSGSPSLGDIEAKASIAHVTARIACGSAT